MSAYRRQALLDAPVESIWELVGDPARHPEWWPRVVEVTGQRFEQGDQYVQVTKTWFGNAETNFAVDRLEQLREIRIHCTASGTYAHWLLTEAQGGTFVDVELGIEPTALKYKVFDGLGGRLFYRGWLEQSLESLRNACTSVQVASP
jgi:uncharacterized protein YndB with AHSA1/START domain